MLICDFCHSKTARTAPCVINWGSPIVNTTETETLDLCCECRPKFKAAVREAIRSLLPLHEEPTA
jgi:hypothetical protein